MRLSACEEERNQTTELMGQIAAPTNLQRACKQVVRNGGSGGVDGMTVKELKDWLTKNINQLQAQLLEKRVLQFFKKFLSMISKDGALTSIVACQEG